MGERYLMPEGFVVRGMTELQVSSWSSSIVAGTAGDMSHLGELRGVQMIAGQWVWDEDEQEVVWQESDVPIEPDTKAIPAIGGAILVTGISMGASRLLPLMMKGLALSWRNKWAVAGIGILAMLGLDSEENEHTRNEAEDLVEAVRQGLKDGTIFRASPKANGEEAGYITFNLKTGQIFTHHEYITKNSVFQLRRAVARGVHNKIQQKAVESLIEGGASK